jgi:UDP-3-O-[3-hydroxymyristoyl] glucosamine N-acyltransferase
MSELFSCPRPVKALLADIVACTGAEAAEGADLSAVITGAAAADEAQPGELTFLDSPESAALLETSRATACFVSRSDAALLPEATVPLVVEEPYQAFILALRRLLPQAASSSFLAATAGISPEASAHPEARLEHGVIVEPGAVIGPWAEVGSGTIIGATSVIGASVRVGRECLIGPQVTITHALVGDRVTLHPGVRIGQPSVYLGHPRVGLRAQLPGTPRLGRVIIQDGVEIGANATVDRGIVGDTVIGEGTRIGNLARIGENAMTGRYCAVPACAEISAHARLGDYCAVPRGRSA